MADVTIKRGNHYPGLRAEVVWPETIEDMPDWTGSTGTFYIRLPGAVAPDLTLAATSWEWEVVSEGRMEGVAKYAWVPPPAAAETDLVAGIYNCEFEVTTATGRKVTFPNGGFGTVEFVERLSP